MGFTFYPLQGPFLLVDAFPLELCTRSSHGACSESCELPSSLTDYFRPCLSSARCPMNYPPSLTDHIVFGKFGTPVRVFFASLLRSSDHALTHAALAPCALRLPPCGLVLHLVAVFFILSISIPLADPLRRSLARLPLGSGHWSFSELHVPLGPHLHPLHDRSLQAHLRVRLHRPRPVLF